MAMTNAKYFYFSLGRKVVESVVKLPKCPIKDQLVVELETQEH